MPGPASASTGPAPAIVIAGAGEDGTVEADVVVAGVGAAPETSLAEAAGIETADGAVMADPGAALKSVLRSPVAG
jgi:pyruvate/2-oxoglutarate dehydrogenase complex dihydrolipoamide dehydrogenase (E3) component